MSCVYTLSVKREGFRFFEMFFVTVCIFIFVVVLAFKVMKPKRHNINLPGPWGLPIVGSAFEIERRMYRTLNKWSKKYGPMCKVKLGPRMMVLISDSKIAKEMLAIDAFVGRANIDEFTLFEGENIGLISSEGEIWEQQRRYVVKQLRDFGFGKSSMESVIIEEVNDLSRRLAAFNSEPVEGIKNELSLAVVNSLWNIVAGTRYNQDDPKLRQIAYQVTGAFEEAAKSGGLLATVKWIKYVMPELSGYNAIRRAMNDIVEFVSETIKQHQATYQEDSRRDFIVAYLAEIKSTTDPQSSFYGEAAEKQLIAVVSDLLQAGIDTTSTTLDWAILYLEKQPEILKKLQKEIDEITGNSRQVSFSDRPKMPYTLAVINELLRISIVPFGAPHRVIFDTEFKGVFFPKDTFIFINMHYMHHDPKLWEDPDSFRPERFLSADEKTVLKIEHLNPFLIGRRQCPGESLAKDTIFLFLSNLVQRFDIMKDPSSPEPTTEPAVQFTITTQPYKVIFKERNLV